MTALIANPEDAPRAYGLKELEFAAHQAVAVGASPPLEFVGVGMTGVVFCDDRYAYKVARSPQAHRSLAQEAEWLETARSIPEVRPFVAELVRYDQPRGVIVRECVRGRVGAWALGTKVNALYDRILPYMLAEGWTMPELKEDSVVFQENGQGKIVDAGSAHRISNRMLAWVEDVLEGRQERESYENYTTLAHYIRREFGQKEKMDEARAHRILDRLYALGAER